MSINALQRADTSKSRMLKDRIFYWLVIAMAVVTISPIVLIISKLIIKGYRQISFEFIIRNTPDTYEAMTAISNNELIPGGIANGIVGTLLMVLLAAVIAIPAGLITGIYLYENPGKKMANLTRNISDIIQGVPSIVLGLIALFMGGEKYNQWLFGPGRKCFPFNYDAAHDHPLDRGNSEDDSADS